MNGNVDPIHVENANRAKELYVASRTPDAGGEEWRFALKEARRIVAEALRASDYLEDVSKALELSGHHMRVFRHLMAPPTSQDQFKLLCDAWPKASEKAARPVSPSQAAAMERVFVEWRDPAIGAWLNEERSPTKSEVRKVLLRVAPLIASQELATFRRNLWAARQEKAVVDLLLASDWMQLPSRLIDTRAAVPNKHFMHKTRFATKTTAPQEVDVACGLKDSYVAAMECKVTNDETNSVKRVNDVLKKATAWKDHWGSFVETVALLQGVIAPKDVQRLADSGVVVFWSHDLSAFKDWLGSKT